MSDNNTMKKGKLFLIPVPIGESHPGLVIPEGTLEVTRKLRYFIAENAKSARAFMKKAGMPVPFSEIEVLEIDKHEQQPDFNHYFNEIRKGNDTGLLSEAGMPGVADPGAQFVHKAHHENIKVIPLSGPSSIFMALSASGLNGQGFVFHGYLPKEKTERIKKIQLLERDAKQNRMTQIFIETPYRNQQLLTDILATCKGETQLCIAAGITQEKEFIKTRMVKDWSKTPVNIDKLPAVFLLL